MEEKILRVLRESGGNSTRSKLIERVSSYVEDFDEEAYWIAEQDLVDLRKIERRRGRKGGIYLLDASEAEHSISEFPAIQTNAATITDDVEFITENQFYRPVLETLLSNWTSDHTRGFKEIFGCVTAHQGRRITGGRWSRPDIVVCIVSDFVFSSRPEGDVRSIELKRFQDFDVLAVYEALSHKSRAHYSYVLVVGWPDSAQDTQGDIESVLAVAEKYGIGIIAVRNIADWDTWEFVVEPKKSDADNQSINMMLLDQVPKEVRDNFSSALRTVSVKLEGKIEI